MKNIISKGIFTILFLLFSQISFGQENVKYYRYCDNFNNPIFIRFWGEIKENQLEDVKGRYFKATYRKGDSRKRAFRLHRIDHYYLNQRQPIYNYQEPHLKDQIIEYAAASTIMLEYDNYDRLKFIKVYDKDESRCLNSCGVSKYEYNRFNDATYKFTEKTFSLDENSNYVLRTAPLDNNVKIDLRHTYITSSDGQYRVWSKIHKWNQSESYSYTYPRGSNGLNLSRRTIYFHPETSYRTFSSAGGVYEKKEDFEKSHGFLSKVTCRDQENVIVGLIEEFILNKNINDNTGIMKTLGYTYTRIYKNENDEIEDFNDESMNVEEKFNTVFQKESIRRFDERKEEFVIKRLNDSEGVRLTENFFTIDDLIKTVIKSYNNRGLLVSEEHLKEDVLERHHKFTYDYYENKSIQKVTKLCYDENLLLVTYDESNRAGFPKVIYEFNERGFKIDEKRFSNLDKELGSDLEFGDTYPHNHVPQIKWEYNNDGSIIEKKILDGKDKYFDFNEFSNPEEFEELLYTKDINDVRFVYKQGEIKEFRHKNYGTSDDKTTEFSYRNVLVNKLRMGNSGKIFSSFCELKDKSPCGLNYGIDRDIIRKDEYLDKYGRLTKIIRTKKDLHKDIKEMRYSNRIFPNLLFSEAFYFKEISGIKEKSIFSNYYHSIHYSTDNRGNRIERKLKDINGKYILNRSGSGEAWVKRRYDHNNFIIEEKFFNIDDNAITIKNWEYSEPIHKIQYVFDNRRNPIEVRTFGISRQGDLINDILIDEFFKKYDENNRVIEESKKVRGRYIKNSSGTFIQKYKYDSHNNMTIIYNYNQSEEPMEDVENKFGVLFKYDKNSAIINKTYLSKDYDYDSQLAFQTTFKYGTKIKKEVFRYDEKGNVLSVSYYEDVKEKKRASDANGVSYKYEHVSSNSYEHDTIFFLNTEYKPVVGPEGYAKKIFGFNENGKNILSKYYVADGANFKLKYKGCADNCEYFEKVTNENNVINISYWNEIESKDANEERVENDRGIHKIVISKNTTGEIKSVEFYGLKNKTNKTKKIETIEVNRLLEELNLSDEIIDFIEPIHKANMDYRNGKIYVSCKNKKGQEILFDYKELSYKYMVFSNSGNFNVNDPFRNDLPIVIER